MIVGQTCRNVLRCLGVSLLGFTSLAPLLAREDFLATDEDVAFSLIDFYDIDCHGRGIAEGSLSLDQLMNSDGTPHTHDNLLITLAGGGGGRLLNPGRKVDFSSTLARSLGLRLAEKMEANNLLYFEYSTARISNI